MERSLRKTVFFVSVFHFLILFFLYWSDGKDSKKTLPKNIVVNTFTLKEPLPIVPTFNKLSTSTAITSPVAYPDEAVVSIFPEQDVEKQIFPQVIEAKKNVDNTKFDQPKPKEIKKAVFSEPLKKVLEKHIEKRIDLSKVSTKKSVDKLKEISSDYIKKNIDKNEMVSKRLIDELQKDLLFIEKPMQVSKKVSDLKVPTLSSLQITKFKHQDKETEEEEESGVFRSSFDVEASMESEFRGMLIDFFKRELKLPEYGEVKVKMKIREDGKINNIVVLSSKNKKNEEYLKSILLKIYIPWLNKYLSKKDEVDITVCFTNDI